MENESRASLLVKTLRSATVVDTRVVVEEVDEVDSEKTEDVEVVDTTDTSDDLSCSTSML
jgi:hypothetical protein